MPITPCRTFDTRVAGAGGRLTGARSIAITGADLAAQGGKSGGCGIPAGAVAVEASVTAVAPAAAGRLRAYPVGGAVPTYAFLEWTAAQSITNTGLVNLATGGSSQLVVASESGSVHVVVDVQGYFVPKATAPATAARYVPLTPCRIVDTRVAGGPFSDQATRSYAVRGGSTAFAAQGGRSGGCGIPSGAVAVEASVTAVSPASGGYARAWPSDASPPAATFLNFQASRSLTNTGTFSLAGTASAKPLTLRSYGTKTQYVIDVQGYFVPQATAPASAAAYVPLANCALVDTRAAGGALATDEARSYVVKGTGAAFAAQGVSGGGCNIPAGAVAVEVTLTARSPGGTSFARLWPVGAATPTATFLNAQTARDIANTGTVAIAAAGSPQLTLRNYGKATHYTLSAQGYFAPLP
ncbi:hypothetical protein KSP35_12435 [Aquihabitans sp. G128]|uniref:hypothetical protein n=1 Tax=Aquihabitans sp. G128 TaxID=2849779 RepID=UPI001C22FFEE|nr:hypothetical protein [Aquihabitans sp. G128]QXC59217.1 hypothetical protein KSP35_12435 [Aquihabitans sp. G128]